MNTVQKLRSKYVAAKELNNKLATEIGKGNGATGLTATFFANANKDLVRIQNQIRSELNRGNISVEEYKTIIS